LRTEKTTVTHLGTWELGGLGDGAWGGSAKQIGDEGAGQRAEG